MKFVLTYLLLLSLVAPKVYNLAVYANYEFNIEAYIESCINKEKPKLECNGKCHLMAEFVQPEEQQPSEESTTLTYLQELFVFHEGIEKNATDPFLITTNKLIRWIERLPGAPHFEIFIPPKV